MGSKYPLNRTIIRIMSVVVLLGVVLPNTLTAGHWNYLITSNAEAHVREHDHGEDHDHSGHNQTPAPTPPDVQFMDEALAASLDGASLWALPSAEQAIRAGEASAPTAPPPRPV